MAEGLGATGIRIEGPGELRDSLRAPLSHRDGPVVADVVVDRH